MDSRREERSRAFGLSGVLQSGEVVGDSLVVRLIHGSGCVWNALGIMHWTIRGRVVLGDGVLGL